MNRYVFAALAFAVALVAHGQRPASANHDLGFTDTPMLPGLPWHVHDPNRPHPPVVAPSQTPGQPPSDAIVLFDGNNLSHWQNRASPTTHVGAAGTPEWKLIDGCIEVVAKTGDLATKEVFGDIQLHVEWSSPNPPTGSSQGRGNSGILLMGRYEVQILDPWENPTYADGQAGAIYGQWPPLANPGRKPGEWNAYDIIFEAPHLDGDKVLKPAFLTVIFNGVVVQNHQEVMGPMVYRQVAHYVSQPAQDSVVLQNHNNPVRFRNIWVRRMD